MLNKNRVDKYFGGKSVKTNKWHPSDNVHNNTARRTGRDHLVLRKGAEAEIDVIDFLGEESISKTRVVKNYRIKEMDDTLRKTRTRKEARLISEARALGILTPFIYFVDLEKGIIVMEYIKGWRLKDYIDEVASTVVNGGTDCQLLEAVMIRVGADVGNMHTNHITHGDLTTSNILLYRADGEAMLENFSGNREVDPKDVPLYFIDFSLGERRAILENLGEDLDVFLKAFESTHPTLLGYLDYFWMGYKEANPHHEEVKERLGEIKKRARYR